MEFQIWYDDKILGSDSKSVRGKNSEGWSQMNQICESLLWNMIVCPEKADINPELGVVVVKNRVQMSETSMLSVEG